MNNKLKKWLGNSFFSDFISHTDIREFDQDSLNPSGWPDKWKKVHYKNYPRFEEVSINVEGGLPKSFLEEVLRDRESRREFNDGLIDRVEMAKLMLFSVGRKDWNIEKGSDKRFYPSAGARYPIEAYLAAWEVGGFKEGVYHYNVFKNSFDKMWEKDDLVDQMVEITGQEWVKKAKAVIVLTAVHRRTTVKYGDRGVRYIMLEAGHIAQNFYLICEVLGLKCCAIGGFIDEQMNEVLDLDGAEESSLYVLAIGN